MKKQENFFKKLFFAPTFKVRKLMLNYRFLKPENLKMAYQKLEKLEHDDPNVAYERFCKMKLINKDYWW